MVPWQPTDSLGIMRTMGLFLSYSWCHDLLRDIIGNLENENGVYGDLYEMADEISPSTAEFAFNLQTVLSDDDLKKEGLYSDKTLLERYREGLKKFPRPGPTVYKDAFVSDSKKKKIVNPLSGLEGIGGSNCWVISGKYTKTGRAILVGDPHLKNAIPSMWHIMVISSVIDGEPVKFSGATLPGLPFVMMGRSEHL